jgi:hypothetical protein
MTEFPTCSRGQAPCSGNLEERNGQELKAQSGRIRLAGFGDPTLALRRVLRAVRLMLVRLRGLG